jgi:hypothetical protein
VKHNPKPIAASPPSSGSQQKGTQTAMYRNLTPYLARARFNDRLARAEAQQLAAAAKQSRPPRRRLTAISVTMRALLTRLQARRPAASTVARTRT